MEMKDYIMKIRIRLFWFIQDIKYWIDYRLCPPLFVKDGIQYFKYQSIHNWLCKDFPDAW